MGFFSRREQEPPKPPSEESRVVKKKQVPEMRSNERVTREVVPEELGTVGPRGRGINSGLELRLSDTIFVGSKKRQERVLTEIVNKEKSRQLLHVAELSSEEKVAGTADVATQRKFSYVQTPDGRLHSTEAKVRHAADAIARKAGFFEAHERRQISPEGRVLSVRRSSRRLVRGVEVQDIVTEKLTYDTYGNVFSRETQVAENGNLVYGTQQMLDKREPDTTVTQVLFDHRDEEERQSPNAVTKTQGNSENFLNGFYSEHLELLED